jgi:hypothetical protein
MRVFTAVGLAVALAFGVSANAAELKSGPQKGEEVGAFEVVKVAGNAHDGVKVGEELCYRCKLGNRPVVMVFARKTDKNLAKLVKELDKVVAKNQEEKKMGAFVNLIGTKDEEAKKAAEKLVKDTEAANIAVVVPKDQPNGPESYKIDPKADVTVLIYVKGEVAANHALTSAALDDKVTKQIIEDTSKILN